jgi:hypothetical protein
MRAQATPMSFSLRQRPFLNLRVACLFHDSAIIVGCRTFAGMSRRVRKFPLTDVEPEPV